ncbi:MAG: 2'-5' RNA ligase family protein [Clostridiales bacterium]|nr:2'-5' RNA ligase family protein [Clostridiales bacterium]
MDNKALYILASYDDATEKHLAGIQNKLYENGFSGWQTRNLPMHITMASFPTDQEETLIEKVKKVASETSAFDITFNHAGIFQGSNTLFIGPDANAELIALRKAFNEDIDWTAHTTMLIDEPETIYSALPIVMKELSSFRGKVTTLHLYEFFPARHILSVDLAK